MMILRWCVIFLVCSAYSCLAKDQGVDAATVPTPVAKERPAPKVFLRPEALVSTAELTELLSNTKTQKLVVIDARSKEAYAKGHILGAVHSNSDEWQDTNALPHCLILREKIRKICQEIGIHGDSLVVLYDDDDGRLAARIWFTLHAYGHEKVAILNGGVAQWLGDLKDESKGWSVELVKPTEVGTFEPNEKLRGVVGFNELPQFKLRVQELGKLPAITLIDARSLAEYMGDDVRGKASGHIPGAANLEWSAVMVGKEHLRRWRSPPEIHAILRVGGIDGTHRIAVYDQAGGRSSHLYFTLWLMGFEKLHNYTAGWREYGNKDGVEIEK